MKAPKPETIRRRAIKAGLKEQRRVHHPLSREEVLDLEIQVLPLPWRIFIGLTGLTGVICALAAWPLPSPLLRILEGVAGVMFLLLATFGIRRTLSELADRLGSGVLETLIDSIVNAIDF